MFMLNIKREDRLDVSCFHFLEIVCVGYMVG